jgi:hypothetical protein
MIKRIKIFIKELMFPETVKQITYQVLETKDKSDVICTVQIERVYNLKTERLVSQSRKYIKNTELWN